MLTGPDGTKQGGKTKYAMGARRKCLYEFLQSCICENRRAVTELRKLFASEFGRTYVYRAYQDDGKKPEDHFVNEKRENYFAHVSSEWLSDSVVLIDPDTGLQTEGPYWTKRPERYVKYADIARIARRTRGNSALIVVQFPQLNANRGRGDLDCRAERLRRELACSGIDDWSVFWIAQRKSNTDKVGDLAFFVLAPRPDASGKIGEELPTYAKRHGMVCNSLR